ncbi:alpha/beta hydrolase [Neorhizobium sp. BETTINA12A]|uniref:alpha/beta hydrolase n=1 Tax=Neorhizobium sp. BETTINA12A TaxID=2908924 RepID=UPI001FF511A0|nr:alpha/beta hydrolase [Neorhizobium sp. BETTINA12A]MCJ9750288.1 alpha/beta hydrolase [Neorhizobium sp. BETTINA12A]
MAFEIKRIEGKVKMRHRISDWDNAYANGINIPQGDRWPAAWVEPARLFRETLFAAGRAKLGLSYGERPRNRFDLFLPETEPAGLVVFVHGGFWIGLDNSYWSQFARGSVERGYAVAMPMYTLAPEGRISSITVEIGKAIEAAAKDVAGPIRLIGHSAGGHLVTRMISATSPLPEAVRSRIAKVVSLSGLHDLRPLLKLTSNAKMRIDAEEAQAESPALLEPFAGARVTCWVGAGERAEFIRQNALLASIWKGLGAETEATEEPDKHHFNVLDGMEDPAHPLMDALFS